MGKRRLPQLERADDRGELRRGHHDGRTDNDASADDDHRTHNDTSADDDRTADHDRDRPARRDRVVEARRQPAQRFVRFNSNAYDASRSWADRYNLAAP